jgi:hypothetical protein
LLSDRLNSTAASKVRLVLSIGLIGIGIVALVAIIGYLDITSSLVEKSDLAIRQENELLMQKVTTAEQQEEIQAKTLELVQLQVQMDSLLRELDTTEQTLEQEYSRSLTLEAEINGMQDQSALLQTEISVLQSKISLDEQRIEELARQNSVSDRISVSHYGVGVDQNDQGIVFPIKVEIINSGSGILSVDINNVQYEPGFQNAVRAAATAAAQYSGESISDKDIVVRFAYDDSVYGGEPVEVDGSSAGAIIAAMIAAGLSEKEINNSVLVTGSISEDGTVGRIGSLEEKIIAADTFGAEMMLVPESQEFDSDIISIVGVSDLNEIMARLTT